MAALLWLLLFLLAFVIALASSTRLRKNAFIWFSYATITGWYYFRVLHKKYSNDNKKKDVAMPPRSSSSSSSKNRAPFSTRAVKGVPDPGLVYFEPREVVERRQLEQLELSGSSHLSDSTSSGDFDVSDSTPRKRKRGRLFRSRRKAAAEEAMRRVSDTSSADLLTNSGASDSNVSP
ncbi:unnamed protein product [Peronospora belbahrii]|uniref:Uncharacterized protein n=1 Tax=Peronospora belbahrii TaxID=622444 RepID=A0AAU9L7D6_9STRA|nr:unnamed protein product [Peronospora belbahrii]